MKRSCLTKNCLIKQKAQNNPKKRATKQRSRKAQALEVENLKVLKAIDKVWSSRNCLPHQREVVMMMMRANRSRRVKFQML